jgi:DNA-binding NtrC family response regulator
MNFHLASKQVLVVEDELLVSMLIEDVLVDAGCRVVGPFTNLSDALLAARNEAIDIALLDVNLRGEKVYPVADILTERDIPFVFLSGYGKNAIPTNRPKNWRVCSKPFSPNDLTQILTERIQDRNLTDPVSVTRQNSSPSTAKPSRLA